MNMDKCFVLHTGQSFIAHQAGLQGIIIRNSHTTIGSTLPITVIVTIAITVIVTIAITVIVTIARMVVVGFSAAEE